MLKKRVILLACSLLLLLSGCTVQETGGVNQGGEGSGSGQVEYAELEVGDTAPSFTGTLLSGGEFSLDDISDTVVFINIWATWCGPCLREMPDIQELREAYSQDELKIVLINAGEAEKKVRDYIEGEEYTFDVILDPEFDILRMYPTDGIPYTVVLNKDKRVSFIQLGSDPKKDMFELFEGAVDSAMAE